MHTTLTATAGRPAARSLQEICQAARRGHCGPFCGALPGEECVVTTAPACVPVTRGTPVQPARGYHLSRFAQAQPHGLISAAELAAVTAAAGTVTPAAVLYDTIPGGAISGHRTVPGPFQTAAEPLAALRPADGSCAAAESRLGLLTGTRRAAGAGPGHWDRQVARWLAGLDVQIYRAGHRLGQPRRPRTRGRPHRPGARRRDRRPDRADRRLPGLRASRARGLRRPPRGRGPGRRVRAGAALPGHRAGGAVTDPAAVSRRPGAA